MNANMGNLETSIKRDLGRLGTSAKGTPLLLFPSFPASRSSHLFKIFLRLHKRVTWGHFGVKFANLGGKL